MTAELQTDEKKEVIIHHARTPVPNVLEENFEELHQNLDVLALQEILLLSLENSSHNHLSNASGSGSRSNHEIGQSSHGGNPSVTTNILPGFAFDEALAQQYQVLENFSANASLTVLRRSETGENTSQSSTTNDGSASTEIPGQVIRQDSIDPDNMSHEQLESLEEEMGNVNRGLPHEVISNLRQHRCGIFSRKAKKEECVICKSNYKREKLMTLPCKHCYHARCITRWLKESKACPVCKEEVSTSRKRSE